MTPIAQEIQQLLEMIPYLDANERTELLVRVPHFSEEKQQTIRDELWRTIRQLLGKVPLEAFMAANFTESEKEEILRIEEAYLHDLREIEHEMRQEFLAHEEVVHRQDEEHANTLLLSLA